MLTVGQLARIFNISAKTIRHYDAVGLFKPAQVGTDNQYRLYQPEQLSQLRRILQLRSVGIGIDALREWKESGMLMNAETITRMLLEHTAQLQDQIERQQQELAAVQRLIAHISISGGMHMQAKLVHKKAFTVVGMPWNSKESEGTISEMWERFLEREHEVRNKSPQPDISYGMCAPGQSEGEFTYVAGYQTDGAFVPEGMIAVDVPEQHYAVFTHTGSVSGLRNTFELIYSEWLPAQGLQPVSGYDFEYYDARFLGPDHERSEIDVYVPVQHG